eukprot:CAMPEP_0175153486 /NCGR_PEP_ID=MMETSP0087-20121206/19766_1 /TAXON_ID=136419 /ORGANISM="Unknown Unknown, Strain D1" /LENGTH=268 /DNA_ID=CAMNT_0016440175 /DNA_START=19 /DNA_END=825 /DNA_ORIENTATION=+
MTTIYCRFLARNVGRIAPGNFPRLFSHTVLPVSSATAFRLSPFIPGGNLKSAVFLPTRSFSSSKREEEQKQHHRQEEHGQQGKQKKTFFEQYEHWLNEYPLLTKAISSAFIVAMGDVFAQLAIEHNDKFNWQRLLNMGIMGGIIIGPTLHVWYGVLNRVFVSQTTAGAVTRMAADQAVFAPLFIPVIFGYIFAVEGRLGDLEQHLRNNWWDTTLTNWTLWIPAQFITFRFIPANFQVIFVNIVALAWNTYVSWKGHIDHKPTADSEHK